MAISREETEREKQTLPFGWGRFGRVSGQLTGISEPDQSLLAAGVALNPEYRQGALCPGHAVQRGIRAREIVVRAKRYLVIAVPEGRVEVRGMAKPQQPRFLEVLQAKVRPAAAKPAASRA